MPNFSEIFANTPVEDRGGDRLPIGNFTTKVTFADVTESKNGNYGVRFKHTCIEEGPHNGDETWVTAYYTEKSAGIFVETLGKYGITGQMMDADDQAAVQTAVGQVWTVNIAQQKSNPQYTNTYLRKRIEDDSVPAAEDEDEGEAPAPPKGKRPF